MPKATLRKLTISSLGSCLALAALTLPRLASAQPQATEADAPPPGFLELELGLSVPADGTDGSVAFFAPKARIRYAVREDILLGLDWGMALVHASVNGESETQTRGGNPALTVALRFDLGTSRLEVGGGAALPVARFGEDALLGAVVLASALSLDGLRDYWLWAPDTLSFFAPEGRLDLGPGYFHGRLVVNVDRPYGFAFDTGGVWGFFLGAGVYL